MFEQVSEEELKDDLCYTLIQNSSEEANKVSRNEGSKWSVVFRRRSTRAAIDEHLAKQQS